jgi:crossover junction endodeoxyribonuclease RusA
MASLDILINLKLPWPLSSNHLYLRRGRYTFISEKGLKYYKDVLDIIEPLKIEMITRPVSLEIYVVEPNKLKRDLDNLLKSVFDSIVKAGLLKDDSLIHSLKIWKGTPPQYSKNDGYILLTLKYIT